uniref:DNA replication helicase domain-containing protein n=1 Tax=Trichogramma kaykai TaxID=54128 RepID=A0ABD2WA82_9HYME
MEYKFMIMDRVCVIRKQFPICCSYGITIHKSQGLSQKNAAVEAGNDIFKTGQIYVALSRVTSLNGLHLINFDPSKIKASTSAIIEYNRLKQIFRPDLKQYDGIHDMSWSTCIADNRWIPRDIPFETHLNKKITVTEREVQGLPNDDGYSSCVNVTLQCLFNCEAVRRIFSETKDDFIVKRLFQSYESKEIFNVHNLRLFVNAKYSLRVQCNVAEFLQELVNKQLLLQQIMKHALKCPGCSERIVSENKSNYILELILPIDRRSCSLQEIFHYNVENWIIVPIMCKNSLKLQTAVSSILEDLKSFYIQKIKGNFVLFKFIVPKNITTHMGQIMDPVKEESPLFTGALTTKFTKNKILKSRRKEVKNDS